MSSLTDLSMLNYRSRLEAAFAAMISAVRTPRSLDPTAVSVPSMGLLTWHAEGSSAPDSPYYSRLPHHPGFHSGVTIGRGYDMSMRSKREVEAALVSAGLPLLMAKDLALAAGLSGKKAHAFVDSYLGDPISPAQERVLFENAWQTMYKDVQRISSHPSSVSAYGVVPWEGLDPRLLEVVVDLRFRGDYTPRTRALLQSALANNDVNRFKEVLCNRALWPGVPFERFKARCYFLETQ